MKNKLLFILMLVVFFTINVNAMVLSNDSTGISVSTKSCSSNNGEILNWTIDGNINGVSAFLSTKTGTTTIATFRANSFSSTCPSGTYKIVGKLNGKEVKECSETIYVKTAWIKTKDATCYPVSGKTYPSKFTTSNVAYENVGSNCDRSDYKQFNVYVRCGANTPQPPSQESQYACYRADLGNNNFDYKWASSAPKGYTKVSGIKSKTECELLNPNYCENNNISSSKGFDYKCVNSLNTSDITSKVVCQNNSTDFYEVSCSELYSVNYEPQISNEILNVKKGLSFEYKISLTSKKKCIGKFDVDKWNDAYEKANNLVKRAIKSGDTKEKKYYENIRDNIVKTIESYNNWLPSMSNKNISASINIIYKENKQKNENHIENFIVNKVSSKNNKTLSTNCFVLKDNSKVCPFEIEEENKYEMIPPKHYISKTSGDLEKIEFDAEENIVNDLSNSIDGGNKFYISMNAISGHNYSISTEISGLGMNGEVTITNHSCSLNILDDDKELYRIINESNPFVNDTRKIGKNWQNDMYDFTKIIKKDNNNPLYTFSLFKNTIAGIKLSNKNDPNAYLGTCNRKINMQDLVMRPICAEINKYG